MANGGRWGVCRYGYHVPRTVARDNYYRKLEEERAARQGA